MLPPLAVHVCMMTQPVKSSLKRAKSIADHSSSTKRWRGETRQALQTSRVQLTKATEHLKSDINTYDTTYHKCTLAILGLLPKFFANFNLASCLICNRLWNLSSEKRKLFVKEASWLRSPFAGGWSWTNHWGKWKYFFSCQCSFRAREIPYFRWFRIFTVRGEVQPVQARPQSCCTWGLISSA